MTTQSDKAKKAPINTLPADTKLPALKLIAAINKDIDTVIGLANDVQRMIGECGLQALMHLDKHGDIGPCNRLQVGLPKGVRRTALASWLLAHGSLKVNTDPGTRKTAPLAYDKSKKTDALAAMADPWFEHLPEKPLDEVFDLQRAIHMILQRAKGKPVTVHGKVLPAAVANDMLRGIGALVGETFEGEVATPPVVEGHDKRATDEPAPPAEVKPAKVVKAKAKATA